MTDPDPFPFEKGDRVRVDVTDADAAFTGVCRQIDEERFGAPTVYFDLPFGLANTVSVAAYEAEFTPAEEYERGDGWPDCPDCGEAVEEIRMPGQGDPVKLMCPNCGTVTPTAEDLGGTTNARE